MTAVLIGVGIVAAAIAGYGAYLDQAQHTRPEETREQPGDRHSGCSRPSFVRRPGALAHQRWDDSQLIVTGLLSRIELESEPRVVLMRGKAERLLAHSRLGREEQTATEQARAQFRRFLDFRDEALFLDTTRFADGLGNSPEATCRAARLALGVFGAAGTGDEWTLSPLPPALSAQELDEIKRGFYQLLLVLADAVSQSPGAKPAQRADEALQIVGRAEGLHSPATRAFHLRRADFLEMKGDRDGASRANEPKPSGSRRPTPLICSWSDARRPDAPTGPRRSRNSQPPPSGSRTISGPSVCWRSVICRPISRQRLASV